MTINYILPQLKISHSDSFANTWCVYKGIQYPFKQCLDIGRRGIGNVSIFEYIVDGFFQNLTVVGIISIGGVISFLGCSQIYKYMKHKYEDEDEDKKNNNDNDGMISKPYKIINSITRLKTKLFGFGLTRNELEKQQKLEREKLDKKNEFKKKTKNEEVNEYIKKWPIENMSNLKLNNNDISERNNDNDNDNERYDNLSVHESTPDGGIFMKYNKLNDTFYYWSDSHIRYTILDTVARKYCTIFSCGHLYSTMYDNANANDTTNTETLKGENNNENDNENNNDNDNENDNDNDTDDSFLFVNENKGKGNEVKLKETDIKNKLTKSDKNIYFIKKGCVNDYTQTIFVNSTKKENPFHKKISYSEFVKQMINKN